MINSYFIYKSIDGSKSGDPILKSIFKLRYQVYVNEWGFEKPEHHHPDGLEMDEYDYFSRHIYAFSRDSEEVIGTARIIYGTEKPLPIENHFNIDKSLSEISERKIAEISRLAISKNFRRRAIDRAIFGEDDSVLDKLTNSVVEESQLLQDRRKCEHELIRGIYILIYRESKKLGLTHWYAVMARGLCVILNRWGIPFQKIGPEKEYHGIRAPYALSIRDLEMHLEKKNPELLNLGREEIKNLSNS